MLLKCARCNAGHFFRVASLLTVLTGCTRTEEIQDAGMLLPETGMLVLSAFTCENPPSGMPERVSVLPGSAWGRFHGDHQGDVLMETALSADSAGLLLMLVLPEEASFTGGRDHLVVKLDGTGRPVEVYPETGMDLFADSLWENPLVRQTTILELTAFLSPDAVIQYLEDAEDQLGIIEFWSINAGAEGMTALFVKYPDTAGNPRGWGVFTGRGVAGGAIEGMRMRDLAATALMIAGLPWKDTGYLVMQAFSSYGE